jgi:hypothetical protein
MQGFVSSVRAMLPDWNPLTPAESVKLLIQVVDNITLVDTGAFLSHHGDKNWL